MARFAKPLLLVVTIGAVLVGAHLRQAWKPFATPIGIGGDAALYYLMAVHIDREHFVSLDGKRPTWTRLPGYPAFLAVTTSPGVTKEGDQPTQIQRTRAWLPRAAKTNLAVDLLCIPVAVLLALLLGARWLAPLAGVVWAVQPWSTIVACHLLSDVLATLLTTVALCALLWAARRKRARWFIVAGAAIAVAQYVRADVLLLVPSLMVAALCAAPGRRGLRLAGMGLAAYALLYSPWPIRNRIQTGAFHPFGGGLNVDNRGEEVDHRGTALWAMNWAYDERDVTGLWWAPGARVSLTSIPERAFDSPAERAQVAQLIMEYNRRGAKLDADLSARFAAIGAEHRRRHRFNYYVSLPLRRVAKALFPPRDHYGLGTVPTLTDRRSLWIAGDTAVTVAGLVVLLALALRRSTRSTGLPLVALVALKLFVLGWFALPEPRYTLPILPLLAAAAASAPRAWRFNVATCTR